ncbi:PaaI family thioesterase [Halorientalis halophila]|uniref:PaaI family thioesterase n=1 Tax=Halorientalis halophila TaxID=3108499 RepID=UPI003009F232
MAETETVETTVGLPADVYERLGGDDETVTATLETLAADHADLQRSIAQFTDEGGEPPKGEGQAATIAALAEFGPPIGQLLGFELEDVEPGRAVIALQPGPEHANPMGTLHGGVLCDLGDAAMGYAYGSTLATEESFTTLELDVKFLRPVWDQRLTATAEVVHDGSTVGLVECDVTGPDGELVARLESVCMTLRDEAADGR